MEQLSKQEYIPHKKDTDSVSYLGVELEKGNGGDLTPNHDRFKDDVITNFDLEMMKKIAVGLELGQPILLEGGSGLGKTRAVDRMCAELNREFYIANCHKMQVEDLIGSMSTDEESKSGFGWQDGVITQAVRNGGILFLDEYNFMPGETRGGIHQIFDTLLQNKTHITLPENNNEQVEVHPDFRIIAAQNPPGGEFGDREVLDRAQIDRFLTIKLPEELPDDIRKSRLLGSLNINNEITVAEESYIFNGPGLSNEGLRDIPGIEDILQKYLEATKQLRKAQEKGQIASRDYQPVPFGTPRDDQRVMGFIKAFYDGDLNHTMQQALELYYTNKVSHEEDRQKMQTILERVKYVENTNTKRRGLEDESASQEDVTSAEHALEIMGSDQFIGPNDIENTFGFQPENIPEILFSKEELERARELGQKLILYVDTKEDGTAFVVGDMKKILPAETQDDGTFFHNDWYESDEITNKITARPGWRLTTPEVIEGSISKNYLDQTQELIKYVQEKVFQDQELPPEYLDAIEEFNQNKDAIAELMNSNWKEAAKQLSVLSINQLTRENFAEIIYRFAVIEKKYGTKELASNYSWSNTLDSNDELVRVGDFDSDGLDVYSYRPDDSDGNIGVCFSRSV